MWIAIESLPDGVYRVPLPLIVGTPPPDLEFRDRPGTLVVTAPRATLFYDNVHTAAQDFGINQVKVWWSNANSL